MPKPDRGAALAVVLWGLVVGGALLTLVTILAVQEQRAAVALRREERGLVGAERIGAELAAGMTAGELRSELPRTFDSLSLDAGGDWSALVRRLTPLVVLLEVAPRQPVGPASREAAGVRLGWLLGPRPDSVSPVAAVSVGVSGSAQIVGSPPELLQATGQVALFDRLSERATLILPGGTYTASPATVGTSCDIRRSTNWGDPVWAAAPCGGYLPLIRVDGDLTLSGGIGQGILLVNGDLRVTAPFAFHGIVIVKGAVDITAPTDVRGIFAAAELRSGAGSVTQLKVHYSKCVISKDLDSAAPLSTLSSRAWIPLFQAP